MKVTEAHELARVMQEITDAVKAQKSVLTIHPEGNAEPRSLCTDQDSELQSALMECLLRELADGSSLENDEHVWLSCEINGCRRDILAMPVQQVPGHSRLIISAIFDNLSEQARHKAEAVYVERRPFAVGYFRLWQADRIRSKRIDALETALNCAGFGVLLLDREGRLVFANQSANSILDSGEGLRRGKGGIAGANLQDNIRLQVAIEHVVGSGAANHEISVAPILKLSRHGKAAIVVSVLPPDKPAVEAFDVAAIIYVLDPELDVERLLQPVCKLYNLSPTETKLSCLLASGFTLTDAAITMHVKDQTIRSCLKQIFFKTDTNRQADLIRLMLLNLIRTTRAVPFEVV